MKLYARKLSILLSTVLLSSLFMQVNVLASPKDNFRVSARNAIAMDRETKQIIFNQNGYELVPMASTTKILTALITIERGNLDEKFTVSKNAASIRGSKVGYKAG